MESKKTNISVELDTKTRVLFWSLAVLTVLSLAATYHNTIVLWNFTIIDDVDDEMLLEE